MKILCATSRPNADSHMLGPGKSGRRATQSEVQDDLRGGGNVFNTCPLPPSLTEMIAGHKSSERLHAERRRQRPWLAEAAAVATTTTN